MFFSEIVDSRLDAECLHCLLRRDQMSDWGWGEDRLSGHGKHWVWPP